MRGKAKNYTVRLPDGTVAKPYCDIKKRADGAPAEYWYAWRGPPSGPRLLGNQGSSQWMECLIAAHAVRGNPRLVAVTTVMGLLSAYQVSPEFGKRAPRTKIDYVKHIKKAEAEIGTLPLAVFDKRNDAWKKVRGAIMLWRDKLALASPRQSDYMVSVLSAIFNWGIDRGFIENNPFARIETLYHGTRRDRVWTVPQETAWFSQTQYAHMHLPVLMGLWTGQREGDILRAKWGDYDGETLRILQQKTGVRVEIPIAVMDNPLKTALDAELTRRKMAAVVPLNLADCPICVNRDDEPWRQSADLQYHGFGASFAKARRVAGIKGVAFTDLRGTFVTRARAAGMPIEAIAEITGHSRAEINAILDKHYLRRDPEGAQKVIHALAAIYGRRA